MSFGRALERKIEDAAGYCAVWAIGTAMPVYGGPGANRMIWPVRFGFGKDPSTVVRGAAMWVWHHHLVLRAVAWCRTTPDAAAVKLAIEASLGRDDIEAIPGGARYWDMTAKEIEDAILWGSLKAGVPILDDAGKNADLASMVRSEVRRVQQHMVRG